MKAREFRELSIEELQKRLADEEESLANLRFQLATSQLENPVKVRTVRRDIARIKTVLRARELAQTNQAATIEVKTS
jgi:large subunit ribosomal protein L29